MARPLHFAFSMTCLFLAGCAGAVPKFPRDEDLPIELIVHKIQCELKAAVETQTSRYKWFKEWTAAYTLTFEAEKIYSVKPGVVIPIVKTAFPSLELSASAVQTSDRIGKVEFTLNVGEVGKYRCRDTLPLGDHPLLTGNIGLADWLDRALRGTVPQRPYKYDESLIPEPHIPTSISHSFEFGVDLQGGATGNFAIVPTTIAVPFSGDHLDKHSLDVAFAGPTKAEPPKPIVIVIKGLGGPASRAEVAPTSPPGVQVPRAATGAVTVPFSANANALDALHSLQFERLLRNGVPR